MVNGRCEGLSFRTFGSRFSYRYRQTTNPPSFSSPWGTSVPSGPTPTSALSLSFRSSPYPHGPTFTLVTTPDFDSPTWDPELNTWNNETTSGTVYYKGLVTFSRSEGLLCPGRFLSVHCSTVLDHRTKKIGEDSVFTVRVKILTINTGNHYFIILELQ